jgi:hypothetical protein
MLDVAFLLGMLAVIAYCALAIWANVQDPSVCWTSCP